MSANRNEPVFSPEQLSGPGQPERLVLHIFIKGDNSYHCGKPRVARGISGARSLEMAARGEAVVRECALCGIVSATRAVEE